MISFVTKISSSPDWFVGVESFNLLNPDNTLVETAVLPLSPIDAGTNADETYTSANNLEPSVISIITGLPFSSIPNDSGKALGALKIERFRTN